MRQPCFSPRINPVRDFWFPVQTEQRRRWHEAQIQKLGKYSVSSALPRIASQQAEGARRAFQRGHLRNRFRRRVSLGLSRFFGDFRAPKRATNESTAYRQARLNSRNLSNIA